MIDWYERVGPQERLMQGDIILRCPILMWSGPITQNDSAHETEILHNLVSAIAANVVVMSQACDLEQEHISNVVLCPHISLEDYKSAWEAEMTSKGHNPTLRAWQSHCKDIKDGFLWNLTFLNSGSVEGLATEVRVVDFHDIFTLPRIFLESLLQRRNEYRLRLRPPYREHLSQAFARYFMRVGLPVPITPAWLEKDK